MRIKLFATVLALMIAASLLSGCVKDASGFSSETPGPVPVETGPEESVPEPVVTDTEARDTDESSEGTDTGTETETEIVEDQASSGNFKFKKTADGETWLDIYAGHAGTVVIPDEDPSDGSPVTGIDVWAFRDNETVRKIVVPDTVTTISDSAFMYCSALEEVELPESLKVLGAQAFYRCSSLKKVSIPDGPETLGYAAFMFCEALEEITLPKTLTEIKDSVFSNCGALVTINFRGSEAEWGKITISDSAMPPTWYTTVYDYAG